MGLVAGAAILVGGASIKKATNAQAPVMHARSRQGKEAITFHKDHQQEACCLRNAGGKPF